MKNKKRLIDANDAQERLCAVCKNAFPGPCYPDCCNFVDAIRDSKTVDAVEVVHGRWAFRQSKDYKFCIDAVCTACNVVIDSHPENILEYRQRAIKKKLRHCPHCGAKMDKEAGT